MSFVEFEEKEEFTFERPKYLRFVEGTPLVVRILDKKAYHVHKHWINRQKISLLCLGDACPICERSEKIRLENPSGFRGDKSYVARQNRYMVNVLDRTPVIVDPETGEEYYSRKGNFPTVSSDGERSLVGLEPKPSNTIKVLERGRTLFENLLAIHNETGEFDDDDELVSGGLTTFDAKLVTLGSGTDMTISVIPLMTSNDDVAEILDQNELTPHVLSSLGIQLTAREMEKVAYQGISLSDIFADRRSQEEAEAGAISSEALSDATERVMDTLFSDDELVE